MAAEEVNLKQILLGLDHLFNDHHLKMDIKEHYFFDGIDTQFVKPDKPDAYIYTLIEKADNKVFGCVSISNTTEYNINDEDILTLHVRDIDVPEEHRGMGIARAILLYGICDGMIKCPHITFSDLEDDTPSANSTKNLYYEFGFRFKPGDPQEKMLELDSFKQNVRELNKNVFQTFFKKSSNRSIKKPNQGQNRNRSRSRNRVKQGNNRANPAKQGNIRYQTRSQTKGNNKTKK